MAEICGTDRILDNWHEGFEVAYSDATVSSPKATSTGKLYTIPSKLHEGPQPPILFFSSLLCSVQFKHFRQDSHSLQPPPSTH